MEERARLESWKEISAYIRRSVKTCQRWEIDLGLPVHRLDGTPRARVFADPAELDAWIAEKLSHIREHPDAALKRRRTAKKTLRVTAGALAFVALSAVAARLFVWHPPIEFPAATDSVAFLPLENATGDAALEAWRTSLPHLVSLDLIQSRVIGSWNAGDLFLSLTELGLWDVPRLSTEDIVRIGQKVGSGHLATGILRRSGEDLVLDLAIRNPQTAEITHTFRETWRSEEGVFDIVDGLSKKIKLAMNIPKRFVAHDIDAKVGDITTRSVEAFHLYSRADRLVWQGNSLEASRLFQQAADADPGFAEAYYGLFRACRGSLAGDEIVRYGQKAVDLSERLNVWSRYQLRGDFYQNFSRDYDKAITAYKGLLELMDDDLAAYSLAQIYWDLEEYDKAIPLLEAARARVNRNEGIVRLLAVCQAGGGDLGRAERTLDEYLAGHAEVSTNFLHMRAVYAADQGKFEEALDFMDKLREMHPNTPRHVRYSRAPVLISMDDFGRAEAALRPIVAGEDKTQRAYAAMSLVGLYLTQGQIEAAGREARRGIELAEDLGDPDWLGMAHFNKACVDRLAGDLAGALVEIDLACPDPAKASIYDLGTLYLRALVTLEIGRTDEFEARLEDIRDLVTRERYPNLMRAYHLLLGQRELRTGSAEKAVDHLWRAVKLLPSPMGKSNADTDSARYYSALAEAYLRAGAYALAAEMYAKVPPYWEQRINSGDVYARAFYGRARAQELLSKDAGLTAERRKAERAKAAEGYRKFLSLWNEADPVFAADVADARKRLALLEVE